VSTREATVSLYPPQGVGAPKDRQPHAEHAVGLPQGTQVFSADDHISVAEDIFYENFPESMKDQAPRVINEDGAWTLGFGEHSFLPAEFNRVLAQYDPLPGATTSDVDARIRELASDGVDCELAFPNAMLAVMGLPDRKLQELCFRIYNEHIAAAQERSNGRLYGVGIINWWDGAGARRSLEEMKSLDLKAFWMPLKPGLDLDGKEIDYTSEAMIPFWEAIEESGLPVAHHIGETGLSSPCSSNTFAVGMLHNVLPFREMFGRYIFGGILDRHTSLRVGWFEGGINWVLPALQDAEHLYASLQHLLDREIDHEVRYYWDNHMCASFMVDPLGLEQIDRLGVDHVMWSTDYPHNESTFGYSEQSLRNVVDAVGPDAAAKIVSGNVKTFLGV
jgi:predicted TIM-barrel fold metal-dependent hydrolase